MRLSPFASICRRRGLRPAALAVALVLGACGTDTGDDGGVPAEVTLRPFASCGELEAYLQERALAEMNAIIDQLIEQGPGIVLRDGGPQITVPAPAPAPTPAPGGPSDFTTTNTQEAGVDEPDFVKNDGARIHVLHGRRLVTVAAWPPEAARVESSFLLEGQPQSMFLDGQSVVVLSDMGSIGPLPRPFSAAPPVAGIAAAGAAAGPPSGTRVTVVDVAGAPFERQAVHLAGYVVAARRIGHVVHVVTTGDLRWPDLRYWPDGDQAWRDRAAWRSALEHLRRENADAIRRHSLAEWLPRTLESHGGGTPQPLPLDCASFRATTAPVPLGLATVTTLDLAGDGRRLRQTSVLSPANAAYASRDALVLTTPHWWANDDGRTESHTYVHRFDLATEGGAPRYDASGGVPGTIVNSFAMDEEGGYLRIAATRRQPEPGLGQSLPTSDVSVLRSSGGRLQLVGRLGGLAPGERIFSARFEGARGYLVTFRQVDPLFTLDLSDPAHPRVAGELKIPGFSTYLHPLGPDHLLAVGRDTEERPGGWVITSGVALQVFDISDFANPRLQHKHVIGSSSTSTDALYDHHAFNFFPSRGLLGLPFSDYRGYGGYRSTLELFRVDVAAGIAPAGSVDHTDLAGGGAGASAWYWTPFVRRSVMMDDYVYSISSGGLKVHATSRLDAPVATLVFPDGTQ